MVSGSPGHFYVRYQNQQHIINIETTKKGQSLDTSYYKKNFFKGMRPPDSYFNALSKKQLIALYLSNLSTQYKLKGYHQQARDLFEMVINILPKRASLYVNLGNTYERDHKILKALVYYQKALDLNPYLCEAHYNMGLIHYLYTKRYQEAIFHGKIAQKLGCRLHPEFRAFLKKFNQP